MHPRDTETQSVQFILVSKMIQDLELPVMLYVRNYRVQDPPGGVCLGDPTVVYNGGGDRFD